MTNGGLVLNPRVNTMITTRENGVGKSLIQLLNGSTGHQVNLTITTDSNVWLISVTITSVVTRTTGMIWTAKPMLPTTFARSYATKNLEYTLRDLFDSDSCTIDIVMIESSINGVLIK